MKQLILYLLVLLALLPVSFASDYNETTQKLDVVIDRFEELQDLEIESERVNNSISQARQNMQAQRALEMQNGTPNYQPIQNDLENILRLMDEVTLLNDELISAENYVESFEQYNMSAAQTKLDQAKETFELERYEQVEEQIEAVYQEVSDIQARQSTANVILTNTQDNVMQLLQQYGLNTLIALFILATVLFVFQKPISKAYYNKKINDLQQEKQVINQLVKDNQKKYYGKREISKIKFDTRNKKYKELLRDINRKIYNYKEKEVMPKQTS